MQGSIFRLLATALCLIVINTPYALANDPLSSWNDGDSKASIFQFVKKVSTDGSQGFAPPSERIAVFDNDGTLWAEQPMYFQQRPAECAQPSQ